MTANPATPPEPLPLEARAREDGTGDTCREGRPEPARPAATGTVPASLTAAWDRLRAVRRLRFVARSRNGTAGWNGTGAGCVAVEQPAPDTLIFTEIGTWHTNTGHALAFRNIFRWHLDADAGAIHLAHLRFGPDRPVALFALTPARDGILHAATPHHCNADTYAAVLHLAPDGLRLHWTIEGPAKDEDIRYRYT